MSDDAVRQMLDKYDATETVLRFFAALDRFDWAELTSVVADEMALASPGLPEPLQLPRDEFIEGTRARNGGFIATMHGNAGHIVTLDGDRAHVTCQAFTAHIAGPAPEDNLWGYGMNELDLVRTDGGWRVSSLSISVVEDHGDPERIYGMAAARQAAGEGH